MELKIFPYNSMSKSASDLAKALKIRRLKRSGGSYSGDATIINWGSSTLPDEAKWKNNQIINIPSAVALAANKRDCFSALRGKVPIPNFTFDKREAVAMIEAGHIVFCRTKLTAHSGDGIVIAKTVDELVDAPLYTQYVKAAHEFRIHVPPIRSFNCFCQKKVVPKETEAKDKMVKNHSNGYVFASDNIDAPNSVRAFAIEAINSLGLDFGAVDILYNGRSGAAHILEINTAPGITGRTLTWYTDVFNQMKMEASEAVIPNGPQGQTVQMTVIDDAPPSLTGMVEADGSIQRVDNGNAPRPGETFEDWDRRVNWASFYTNFVGLNNQADQPLYVPDGEAF